MKKFFCAIALVIGVIALLGAGFIALLTITEYQPEEIESVPVEQTAYPVSEMSSSGSSVRAEVNPTPNTLTISDTPTITTWNIGYAGLGKNADFVLDGGKSNGIPSREDADIYYLGIGNQPELTDSDFVFIQEIDSDSSRSYHVNQRTELPVVFNKDFSSYALNYSCLFVPFPMPPMGTINSGICTMSNYPMTDSTRMSLPCPFDWPVRVANLKRCVLVSHVDIEGSDKQLTLVNLHLDAYDDGAGRAAQTALLCCILKEEADKGNYVIAGGDFNQSFPSAEELYPLLDSEGWMPGILEEESLPDGFSFAYDVSAPTCRALNQPLSTATEEVQYFVIDGFIISSNLEVKSATTLQKGFEHSDHNPVQIEVEFIK